MVILAVKGHRQLNRHASLKSALTAFICDRAQVCLPAVHLTCLPAIFLCVPGRMLVVHLVEQS